MEVLDGNSFSNYRMGKTWFIQNSFENTCVVMECRDVGVEVEKWRMVMFMKKCTVSEYYDDQSYPVRPHLPPYGNGPQSCSLLLLVWDTSSTEMTPLCMRGWSEDLPPDPGPHTSWWGG